MITYAREAKKRELKVSDFHIVLAESYHDSGRGEPRLVVELPEDGAAAFSAFGAPDYWREEIPRPNRKPKIVNHQVGERIFTGKTHPITRLSVAPAGAFLEAMLSAWIERGIVREVGTFAGGGFDPAVWFAEEIAASEYRPPSTIYEQWV